MRDYLTAQGMASQERAWLEPPCPPPDLVQCEFCEYWVGKWTGFVLESADGEYLEGYLGEYFPNSNHLEIIGNIHDNPELLEGEK